MPRHRFQSLRRLASFPGVQQFLFRCHCPLGHSKSHVSFQVVGLSTDVATLLYSLPVPRTAVCLDVSHVQNPTLLQHKIPCHRKTHERAWPECVPTMVQSASDRPNLADQCVGLGRQVHSILSIHRRPLQLSNRIIDWVR